MCQCPYFVQAQVDFIERGNIDKETVMDIFSQSLRKLNQSFSQQKLYLWY